MRLGDRMVSHSQKITNLDAMEAGARLSCLKDLMLGDHRDPVLLSVPRSSQERRRIILFMGSPHFRVSSFHVRKVVLILQQSVAFACFIGQEAKGARARRLRPTQ